MSVPLSTLPGCNSTVAVLFSVFVGEDSFASVDGSVSTLNFAGSQKVNVVPFPISEVTEISPPSRSMIVLQIERPSPVPCAVLFSFIKRSNTLFTLSAAMPVPVSVTWKITFSPSCRYP